MLKLIVTGTGRCGTGYTSMILKKTGIRTGHENVFGPTGINQHTNYEVEVSWLAVPHLDNYDAVKLGIWRNRQDCVSSLERGGITNGHNPYSRFALNNSTATTPTQFYDEWNAMTREKCDFFINIEDLTVSKLSAILKVSGINFSNKRLYRAFETTPNNINTRKNHGVRCQCCALGARA